MQWLRVSTVTQQWDRLGGRIDRPSSSSSLEAVAGSVQLALGPMGGPADMPRARATLEAEANSLYQPRRHRRPRRRQHNPSQPNLQLSAFSVSDQCAHPQTRSLTTCFCCQNKTHYHIYLYNNCSLPSERQRARCSTCNTLPAKYDVLPASCMCAYCVLHMKHNL